MEKTPPSIAHSGTITLHVPITFRRHGGLKTVAAPANSPAVPSTRSQANTALIKALVRAFRWRKLIEMGTRTTVADLAKAEEINPSYASRILRLTLLAPKIVDAILDGQTAPEMTLARLLKPFPVEWVVQRREFSSS